MRGPHRRAAVQTAAARSARAAQRAAEPPRDWPRPPCAPREGGVVEGACRCFGRHVQMKRPSHAVSIKLEFGEDNTRPLAGRGVPHFPPLNVVSEGAHLTSPFGVGAKGGGLKLARDRPRQIALFKSPLAARTDSESLRGKAPRHRTAPPTPCQFLPAHLEGSEGLVTAIEGLAARHLERRLFRPEARGKCRIQHARTAASRRLLQPPPAEPGVVCQLKVCVIDEFSRLIQVVARWEEKRVERVGRRTRRVDEDVLPGTVGHGRRIVDARCNLHLLAPRVAGG